MLTDIRYGLRQLIKHPGFTFVAVLTLALGIGANTAIFSVVNAVLLKPLPFPQPEQLVAVGMTDTREKNPDHELNSLSYPDFFDYRDQNRSFTNLAVFHDRGLALTEEQEATSLRSIKASGDFFDVLGVKPLIGRGFERADEQAGGGPGGFKVVLSYDFWRRHFGGENDVIGRTMQLDRRAYTIIGVMPAGFQFPMRGGDPTDLYVTFADEASNADGSPHP